MCEGYIRTCLKDARIFLTLVTLLLRRNLFLLLIAIGYAKRPDGSLLAGLIYWSQGAPYSRINQLTQSHLPCDATAIGCPLLSFTRSIQQDSWATNNGTEQHDHYLVRYTLVPLDSGGFLAPLGPSCSEPGAVTPRRIVFYGLV